MGMDRKSMVIGKKNMATSHPLEWGMWWRMSTEEQTISRANIATLSSQLWPKTFSHSNNELSPARGAYFFQKCSSRLGVVLIFESRPSSQL